MIPVEPAAPATTWGGGVATTTTTTTTRPRRLALGLLVVLFSFVLGRLSPRGGVRYFFLTPSAGSTSVRARSSSSNTNQTTVPRSDAVDKSNDTVRFSHAAEDQEEEASGRPAPQQADVVESPTSTSSSNLVLCQREQIIDGRWEPVHLDEPPYRPPNVFRVCAARNQRFDENGRWDMYTWVPSATVADAASEKDVVDDGGGCQFTEWNRDAFCDLARYGTILVVGDSLSFEHYSSLCQLLGVPMHDGWQFLSRGAKTNIGHAVCDGNVRLVYRRDDSLTEIRTALQEVEPNFPQVVVLNRGAHYANDDTYVTELRATLDVVEEWQGRCDQLNIKCHFFWRTTVPGHPNCQNFTAPVNDKAAIEAHIANLSLYDGYSIHYHWYDFQHQNLLAEDELKNRTSLRYRIIDGYHINVLRPDGHYDCLHSCYPGKMDVYNRLLLHYLTIDRTKEDVQRLEAVLREQQWTTNISTVYYDWEARQRENDTAT